ncbi:uroporphyrinogen-III C-methyltransferase [Ectothiorhodospiraceae bacterium WFHF3C12]|nr:uroporphyrinogen-III C-methyltransferase [Ectothiorhodospiraceae bacterium WFHF3C12]
MSMRTLNRPRGLWQVLREALPTRHGGLRRCAGGDGREAPEGHVHLIGCGPGDPELLTLRAARLIREAQVVFYDRLIDPAVLALTPRNARRVYVGKRCGDHAVGQSGIERQMIAAARAGRRVVRLKGGDPFIFGRGGEELRACRSAGIACAVVPGVTAALGCAAEAALPLTFRGVARAVTFATAQTDKGAEIDGAFAPMLSAGHTLALYMGRRMLRETAARLLSQGVPCDLPVAVVLDGTTARQRTLKGTLAQLPDTGPAPEGTAGLVLLGRSIAAAEIDVPANA